MKKNKTPTVASAESAAQGGNTPELSFARSALGLSLMAQLQNGSASYQRIADYFLRNQVKVTALGIEDLAEECRVSTATISRFARELGFTNYAALKNQIADTVQVIFSPVEKLRHTIESADTAATPAQASLQAALTNVQACSQGLDETALQSVIRQISKAATVYVMGFGLSSHLAAMLALHLQPFCQRVVEVVSYGGTEVAAGNLMHAGPQDVLIVISFPRYALDAIRLTQFARDHGAGVVAITDSAASPLAQLSDQIILAPCHHAVLPSSASAAIAVIEALVSCLMTSNKQNVEKAMQLTQALSAYLHHNDNIPRTPQLESRKPKK